MTTINNATIDQFIIDTVLIQPVSDIVAKLENGHFRDCDIKWLNTKLEAFTKFACETLGISIPPQPETATYTLLNEYATEQYLKYFNTLLSYFQTI